MCKSFALMLALTLLMSSCLIVRFSLADPIPGPPISSAYIRSDGSIDPQTLPIHRNGNTFTFTSDISNYTLEIQCSNSILNGAGFVLQGNGPQWYQAVTVQNQNNITIENLKITQFGSAISFSDSSGNTVSGNTISSFNCISLVSSSSNQIVGNSLSNGYGVQGTGSWNNIIGNTFTSGLIGPGQGVGIEIECNNTQIANNIFNDECSIQITPNSQNNTIIDNTLTNGSSGILILKSSYNVIAGNIVSGKIGPEQEGEDGGGGGGLYLSDGSFNNVVYDNKFEGDLYGVSLGYRIVSMVWNNVYNNYFYGNNFFSNSKNVYVAPGCPQNFWNNNTQGNYWSDYNGSDVNHDGIGDSPYLINANNTDYYPVMNPLVISPIPTSTPTAPSQTPTPTTSSISLSSSTPAPNTPSLFSQSPSQTPATLPIEQTQPNSTIIIVISIISAIIVCFSLLLYYKKRGATINFNVKRQMR